MYIYVYIAGVLMSNYIVINEEYVLLYRINRNVYDCKNQENMMPVCVNDKYRTAPS